MNEDKIESLEGTMELEEVIETLEKMKNNYLYELHKKEISAIETVLKALENSIPKKKIEDKIKAYEKLIDDISESERYSHEIPLYRHDIQVLQELLEDK